MANTLPEKSPNRSAALPKGQDTKELNAIRTHTNELREKSRPISQQWRDFHREWINYIFDNQIENKARGEGFQRLGAAQSVSPRSLGSR